MLNSFEPFVFSGINREGRINKMDVKSRISLSKLQTNFFENRFSPCFGDTQIPNIYEYLYGAGHKQIPAL